MSENRFEMSCPVCGYGSNSIENGGNENCFHCSLCGFIECEWEKDNYLEIIDVIKNKLDKLYINE